MTPTGPTPSFIKAEADLEYKLISGMRKISSSKAGIVLFVEGHGEKSIKTLPEFKSALESNGYRIFTFDMNNPHEGRIPPVAEVVIILQPETLFSERDKRIGSVLTGGRKRHVGHG